MMNGNGMWVMRGFATLAFLAVFAVAGMASSLVTPATIPFAFEMNGKAMEAGRYVIHGPADGGLVRITTPKGEAVAILTVPLGHPSGVSNPHLTFEKEAGTYRLREIWTSHTVGAKVPMKRNADRTPVASTPKAETVVVALAR